MGCGVPKFSVEGHRHLQALRKRRQLVGRILAAWPQAVRKSAHHISGYAYIPAAVVQIVFFFRQL